MARGKQRSGAQGTPLEELEEAVHLASHGGAWSEARMAATPGAQAAWRAARFERGDPLQELMARVEQGKRAARFAPPLLGIVSDLDMSSELYGHPELLEVEQPAATPYNLLDVLAAEDASVEDVSKVLKDKGNLKGSGGATSPQSAPSAPPSPRDIQAVGGAEDDRRRGRSGGMIADVMLDAIATRPLAGEARAEAASLLSQGLVLGDEELMREALAILLTGQLR